MNKKILIFLTVFSSGLVLLACGANLKRPTITSFKVSSDVVDTGEEVTISWKTIGGAKVSLASDGDSVDGMGTVKGSGSLTFVPTATANYTLTVAPSSDAVLLSKVSDTLTVTVNSLDDLSANNGDGGDNGTDGSDGAGGDDGVGGDDGTGGNDGGDCGVIITQKNVRSIASLDVSRSQIISGESVTVTWDVTQSDVTVSLLKDGHEISSDLSGNLLITPTSDTDLQLSVFACGEGGVLSETILVAAPNKIKTGVSAIAFGSKKNIIWAGGVKGSLEKSTDFGNDWSTVQSSIDGDTSSINSILTMGSECANALFVGTEGGYVYKSDDNGNHFLDSTGTARAWLTTSTKMPLHFLVADPESLKSLYVGWESLLSHVDDCSSQVTTDVSPSADATWQTWEDASVTKSVELGGGTFLATSSGLQFTRGSTSIPVAGLTKEVMNLMVVRHSKLLILDKDHNLYELKVGGGFNVPSLPSFGGK